MRNFDFHTDLGGGSTNVSSAGIVQLGPDISARGFVMPFSRNEEIYGQEEEADFVYKVVSGVVRLCRVLADGRRQIAAFHFAGDVFGLETGGEHSLCAEAVTDCRVALVNRPVLERAADQDNTTARALWSLSARDVGQLREHMLLLGRKGAGERIAAFLLQMADRSGKSDVVDLPMSRAEIGDYLGLTIETVSRNLTQLERDGVIALPSARHVELRDRRALEAYEG